MLELEARRQREDVERTAPFFLLVLVRTQVSHVERRACHSGVSFGRGQGAFGYFFCDFV